VDGHQWVLHYWQGLRVDCTVTFKAAPEGHVPGNLLPLGSDKYLIGSPPVPAPAPAEALPRERQASLPTQVYHAPTQPLALPLPAVQLKFAGNRIDLNATAGDAVLQPQRGQHAFALLRGGKVVPVYVDSDVTRHAPSTASRRTVATAFLFPVCRRHDLHGRRASSDGSGPQHDGRQAPLPCSMARQRGARSLSPRQSATSPAARSAVSPASPTRTSLSSR